MHLLPQGCSCVVLTVQGSFYQLMLASLVSCLVLIYQYNLSVSQLVYCVGLSVVTVVASAGPLVVSGAS